MAKRFTDTKIWEEDWFIDMPKDYRLFWQYIKDSCDHASIWKPNVTGFNRLHECAIDLKTALEQFNKDKIRIEVLPNGRWYLLGFIEFQYGKKLNPKNRVHKSVLKILEENEVNLTPIRPQLELTKGLKDKDKDKEKEKDKIQPTVNKDEISYPYLVDEIFKESYKGYLEMRKKQQKPATKKAEHLALSDLHKHPITIAIKMLDQSIMRSWIGIFPLKDEQIISKPPPFLPKRQDDTLQKIKDWEKQCKEEWKIEKTNKEQLNPQIR